MKDREKILFEALTHLSSHVPMSMEIYEVIHDTLQKLQAGTYEEQAAAKVIYRALFWPGSNPAREAADAFKAAIATSKGRKAAGLPPKRRGVSTKYDTSEMGFATPQFDIVVRLVKGEINPGEAQDALIEALGEYEADTRTIRRIIEDLRPSAELYLMVPEWFHAYEEERADDD